MAMQGLFVIFTTRLASLLVDRMLRVYNKP